VEQHQKIHRLTWDKNLCDRQMLIDFIKVANQASTTGIGLIKWIRTAYFNRVPMFYFTKQIILKYKSGFNFNQKIRPHSNLEYSKG
jgi:hypothetical protein